MLGKTQSLPSFLWHFIRKYWVIFFLLQLAYLVWVVEFVAWPHIIRLVIDALAEYKGPKDEILTAIGSIVLYGAITWLLIEFGFRASGYISAYVMPKIESDIRMTMFDYVSKHSHTFFANNYSGALANKINDMPRSSHSILHLITSLFVPLLVTTITMTAMFTNLYPLFGIIIFSWVFIHIGICFASSAKCQDLSLIHAESRSKLAGRIVDTFMNNVSVRIFARRKYEYDLAMEYQADEREKHIKALMFMENIKTLLGVICFLFIGVFLTWLEIYSYKSGYIDIGDAVFIFQGAINMTALTWWAGYELPRLFQELGVCKQALVLLNTPHQIVDAPDAKPININKGEIVFENVTFRYERNNNIFQNQNIRILPGQKVGLVGFSGSGKSTFVNLILRYFDINEGRILIDGQDISKVTQDSLHEQIAFIPQEPTLFHRTLMENIRYGNINASDEEVIAAAESAHCHEFIIKLKDKYNTAVGERGLKLSGGQRQRIAIARAILKKAPILIMDEATSALDSVTESYIQESFDEMAKDSTTLIIAHRLSTLAGMDRILVFKDGYIVEDGTHDELLELEGHYKELWDMQSDGFLPEGDDDEEEDY